MLTYVGCMFLDKTRACCARRTLLVVCVVEPIMLQQRSSCCLHGWGRTGARLLHAIACNIPTCPQVSEVCARAAGTGGGTVATVGCAAAAWPTRNWAVALMVPFHARLCAVLPQISTTDPAFCMQDYYCDGRRQRPE